MGIVITNPVGNLPDGSLINNIANFYRATKPLTRVDGSALGIGDRWINSSNADTWIWNGTYWIGATEFRKVTIRASATATITISMPFEHIGSLIQCTSFEITGVSGTGGTPDPNVDYWTFAITAYQVGNTNSQGTITGLSVSSQGSSYSTSGIPYFLKTSSSTVLDFTGNPNAVTNIPRGLNCTFTKFGSASNLGEIYIILKYRLIAP
jgi:hypothetical protein